jgi:polysaccharide export outer membrane protein
MQKAMCSASRSHLMACSLIFLLSGCASLPSSGPTAHQVIKRSKAADADFRFQVVNLDAPTIEALNRASIEEQSSVRSLNTLAQPAQVQTIGPGDVLSITLYEVGVTLFQSQPREGGGGFDPSAHGERFPAITVNENGEITLPYIGKLAVAGSTASEVERRIAQGLRGKSQEPQAIVTISNNVSNTVYVYGDVRRPSRLEIPLGGERVLDAIAQSGGAAYSSEDTLLRFERHGATIDQRLNTVQADGKDDLRLLPGDHLELIRRPRTYTVFGATNKVSQVSFETGAVSLAEAMARVSGPNDSQADPSAIFLFRYDSQLDKPTGQHPIIYRLNMLDPASYFLAQRFAMRDKDVIYIANSAANQPSKLMTILSQLFSPFVAIGAVAR